MKYANIVGDENVFAGSDCGFRSIATPEPEVRPTVVWAKSEPMGGPLVRSGEGSVK